MPALIATKVVETAQLRLDIVMGRVDGWMSDHVLSVARFVVGLKKEANPDDHTDAGLNIVTKRTAKYLAVII